MIALVALAAAATLAPGPVVGASGSVSATGLVAAVVSDDEVAAPPDTVSDFYPDANDLSNCLGLVEKPGCGSSSRGGWRQTAVFALLAVGLGIVIWRITVGLRANRIVRSDSATGERPEPPARPVPDPGDEPATHPHDERNQP